MPSTSLVEPLLKSLYLLATMVEARDPYTGGHLWRVSQFARTVAIDMDLPDADIARITLGGFLHDLGKIGVPDAILNKRDKLSDDEYAVIKTHPDIGARLLSAHPLSSMVLAAVVQHHETPDGRGYPAGLKGSEIALDARIVGVCDAFDAMSSSRPYRAGMPLDKVLGIIEANLGSQFCPEAGSRLLRLGQGGALNHIIGHSESGIPLQACPGCHAPIAVRRQQLNGGALFCRACAGESELIVEDGLPRISLTGRVGNARQLEADIDELLIGELVGEASRHLDLAGFAA
ncbi:HD-GYP domain-containing protein [Chitinimonas sp.]|uniref:HD-GYP domain-containing protein n=1 Tax=Chitinimonas sp. TaxID=1934313 RepID=UPI0035B2832C